MTVGRTGGEPVWPAGRLARLALLVLCAWATLRLFGRPEAGTPLDLVNLAFHEAGHVFLRPFGHIVHVLGGTLFQLGIPALLVWYFLVRRNDPFAAAVCLWWLGESLVNVSVYMADARNLALPLVGGGEHDWNELFFRFGVLDAPSVAAISGTSRVIADGIMVLGLSWGAVLVVARRLRSLIVLRLATTAPWALRLFAE